MLKYVQMELRPASCPTARRFISEAALHGAARAAGDDRRGPHLRHGPHGQQALGRAVVHHGGDLIGYHSDMFWIPDARRGRRHPDERRSRRGDCADRSCGALLEVLYDGERRSRGGRDDVDRAPQAGARGRAQAAGDRRPRRRSPASWRRSTTRRAWATSSCRRRARTRGSTSASGRARSRRARTTTARYSLFTIDPGSAGVEFVVGEKDGKRTLTTRDAQHEYVFVEQ